jgi:hypothetical protein
VGVTVGAPVVAVAVGVGVKVAPVIVMVIVAEPVIFDAPEADPVNVTVIGP